jgi:hypothetical protein
LNIREGQRRRGEERKEKIEEKEDVKERNGKKGTEVTVFELSLAHVVQ